MSYPAAETVSELPLFLHLSISSAFPTRWSVSTGMWLLLQCPGAAVEAQNLVSHEIHYFMYFGLQPFKSVPENEEPGQDSVGRREGK